MVADGQDLLEIAPWISLIPGLMILLATLGFNLLGDGLRDFFDPTQLNSPNEFNKRLKGRHENYKSIQPTLRSEQGRRLGR